MNNEVKENLKVGLLGLIALTLIVNTYIAATKRSGSSFPAPQPVSSAAVAPQTNDPSALSPTPDLSTTISNPGTNATPVNNNTNQKKTRINFGSYVHDFGKIKQNSTNRYSFKFTNTGDEPLIISDAAGSCGCTVPNYPKEPIAPGASATIDVEYKPGVQKGAQDKKVTVTANTEPAQTILTIKAEVQEE